MRMHGTAPGISYRLGHYAGRVWGWLAHQEKRAASWLVGKGLSTRTARVLVGGANLVALGVLLYVAFWLVVVLVFVVGAAWVARNAEWDDQQETEWRTGASGFGLYRGDVRIDVGDPYEDE